MVKRVRAHVARVYVVDDGSIDRTAEVASHAGATVIRNDHSEGKGAALRKAWAQAEADGYGWVLALDGDGQHAPEDIPKFFERANATAAALVVGNRMANPSGMPWIRRFVNKWMSARLSALAGRDLPDTQCGFRLMRLDALREIPLVASHYETESEQVLAFARAGERIEFVPITVIYDDEESHIHPVRDTLRWFKWFKETRSAERAMRKTDPKKTAGI